MNADLFDSIDLPPRSHSIIEHCPERMYRSQSHPPHEHCCGASKPAETIAEPSHNHAIVHAHAANTGILPDHEEGSERQRERAKKFVVKKGPRIAGAAAAIGMFVFNVVTSCA